MSNVQDWMLSEKLKFAKECGCERCREIISESEQKNVENQRDLVDVIVKQFNDVWGTTMLDEGSPIEMKRHAAHSFNMIQSVVNGRVK